VGIILAPGLAELPNSPSGGVRIGLDDLLKIIVGAAGTGLGGASTTQKSSKKTKTTKTTKTSGDSGGSDILGGLLGGGMSSILPLLLPLVVSMLLSKTNNGQSGVAELLGRMDSLGLGDVAKSWVGTEPNKSITPAQAKKIVGADQVAELAKQSGLSTAQVGQGLTHILPELLNHVTPNGSVPESGDLQSVLGGLLGGLGLGR
jgi:uncharacterized protein YidB (DUF937 family)